MKNLYTTTIAEMKGMKRMMNMAMPFMLMSDNKAKVYLTVENDDCSEVPPPAPEDHFDGVKEARMAACDGVSWRGVGVHTQK